MKLKTPSGAARVAILHQASYQSLGTALTKLTERTQREPVIVIRERAHELLPTWKATIAKQSTLLATGRARWIWLDRDDAISLLALDALLQGARSGEVTSENGAPLPEATVMEWLASRDLANWPIIRELLGEASTTYHPPELIRFVLVDPKRVTFNAASFRSAIAAHLEGPIRSGIEDTLPVIEQLVELMEERYRLFEAAQVMDLQEYNELAAPSDRLNRRVLVIDEFQDLFTSKANAQAFFGGIQRLGAKARAAGVHLILATQRPDSSTVPSIIKANLGGKIALRVASNTNARIILDEGGAERLLGKGDLLANLGRGLVRAQSPLLAD